MVLNHCPYCGRDQLAPLVTPDCYACNDCGQIFVCVRVTDCLTPAPFGRAPLFRVYTDAELAQAGKEVRHAN
jgi:hypothetical protein